MNHELLFLSKEQRNALQKLHGERYKFRPAFGIGIADTAANRLVVGAE